MQVTTFKLKTLRGSHIAVSAVLLTNTDPQFCGQYHGSVLVNNTANTTIWEPHRVSGSHIAVFAALLTNTHQLTADDFLSVQKLPLRLRISMSGKCSFSTFRACSQPYNTHTLSSNNNNNNNNGFV